MSRLVPTSNNIETKTIDHKVIYTSNPPPIHDIYVGEEVTVGIFLYLYIILETLFELLEQGALYFLNY